MSRLTKVALTSPAWMPLMLVGMMAYGLEQSCDWLLTRIGEWTRS